ncbi:hypothetical protein [Sphingomonas sp. PAMC 26621]|uniref:hypothetical protein n=1 Tax=Sphingomonas sp. PAMC 26621 TaxID=1112213 RepID=UPI0002D4520A|nr:hypothetical protein [Sphingomonas sp. PAMC 26621]
MAQRAVDRFGGAKSKIDRATTFADELGLAACPLATAASIKSSAAQSRLTKM